jgi:hypothetical protein
MDPFPELHDLIALFEAEPTYTDPGVPAVYNRLTFITERGTDRVRCEVEPANGCLTLAWARDGAEVVRADFAGVAALRIEAERGREILVAELRAPDARPARLQLRPAVHLSWGTHEMP